jgi:phosphatidylglycerophosphatase A
MSIASRLKPRLAPLPPDTHAGSVSVLVATWFNIGRLRPAPGTIGTLAAIPPGFVIAAIGGPLALLAAAMLLLFIGSSAAGYYGRKSGNKDDQSIVVDEVIGMWIAAIPAGLVPGLWVIAFLLFRFFDIYKPWPASFFDNRKKGGMDVLLDDVIAGIFAMCGVATLAMLYVL